MKRDVLIVDQSPANEFGDIREVTVDMDYHTDTAKEVFRRFEKMTYQERKIVNAVSGFPVNPGMMLVMDGPDSIIGGGPRRAVLVAYFHQQVTRRHTAALMRRGIRLLPRKVSA